jgi:FkbM family methyltransferase
MTIDRRPHQVSRRIEDPADEDADRSERIHVADAVRVDAQGRLGSMSLSMAKCVEVSWNARNMQRMTISSLIRRGLRAFGIQAYSWEHIPWGISLERDLQRILGQRPAPTLFDVGANVGQTARLFQRALPTSVVHSFEPIAGTFRELQRVTKGVNGIRAHNLALGTTRGRATMILNGEASKFLVGSVPNAETEEVDADTVDHLGASLKLSRLDLLKTDCEGFDLDVIKGAERMIAEGRIDAILAEVTLMRGDAGHTDFSALHEHLSERGFYFFASYGYEGWGPFHSEGAYHNALWLREGFFR